MDEDFAQSQELRDRLTPMEAHPLMDDDLKFAASCAAHAKTMLRASE